MIEYPPCNISTQVNLTSPTTTSQYVYYIDGAVGEVVLSAFGITSDTNYCDETDLDYSVSIAASSIISVPASFTVSDSEPVKFEWSSSNAELIN
jgi:hypothetical protein